MTVTSPAPAFPYAFARRHGVILLAGDDLPRVGIREGADPRALIEVRRAMGRPVAVESMPSASFDRMVSEIYADSSLGVPPVGGLDFGAGLDGMFDELPTTADLLDPQDDAPIIRLINGLIAEAVRRGAVGGDALVPLLLLAAISLGSVAILPFAAAAALRANLK